MSVANVEIWLEEHNLNYDWLRDRNTYYVKATEDVVRAVRTLHEAGFARKSIETYLWLSAGFVAQILANPDAKSLPLSQGNTSIDEGKVCALYRAGWSIADIAGECSASENLVRETLKKHFGGKK